ncbi:MAG: hypothetical protein QOJ63_2876 [Solirubrobacteraceae bacterium]|jgi:transposase|nr:hypothetical protein [Solirubrobacteraceae bacterium]
MSVLDLQGLTTEHEGSHGGGTLKRALRSRPATSAWLSATSLRELESRFGRGSERLPRYKSKSLYAHEAQRK